MCRINPNKENCDGLHHVIPWTFLIAPIVFPSHSGAISNPSGTTSLIQAGNSPGVPGGWDVESGRFTRYLAQQGLHATGVDFFPVAIRKARKRVAQDIVQPEFLIGDVTHLDAFKVRLTLPLISDASIALLQTRSGVMYLKCFAFLKPRQRSLDLGDGFRSQRP